MGEIETKSRNRRDIPIPQLLRVPLSAHPLRTGRRGSDLVFGVTATVPFRPDLVTARADRAWAAAGLKRIVLHECRHTYAALSLAAGIGIYHLSEYLGHADIKTTVSKYGGLMRGHQDEAARMFDGYMERSIAPASAPRFCGIWPLEPKAAPTR